MDTFRAIRIVAMKSLLLALQGDEDSNEIRFPRVSGVIRTPYDEQVGFSLWRYLHDFNLRYVVFPTRSMLEAIVYLIPIGLCNIDEKLRTESSPPLLRKKRKLEEELIISTEILRVLDRGEQSISSDDHINFHLLPSDKFDEIIVKIPEGAVEKWQAEIDEYVSLFITGSIGKGLDIVNCVQWHKDVFLNYLTIQKGAESKHNILVSQTDFTQDGLNFAFVPALLAFEKEGLISIKSISAMEHESDVQDWLLSGKEPRHWFFARININEEDLLKWNNPFHLDRRTGAFSVYDLSKGNLKPSTVPFHFVSALIDSYPDGVDPNILSKKQLRDMFHSHNQKLDSPKTAKQWFSSMKDQLPKEIGQYVFVEDGVFIKNL